MAPNFTHNDYVLSFAWRGTRYRPGDVVIVKHPQYRTIIKRIAEINNQGQALLAGDNPASTSSNSLGWQEQEDLIGKVIWHIAPQ